MSMGLLFIAAAAGAAIGMVGWIMYSVGYENGENHGWDEGVQAGKALEKHKPLFLPKTKL
jgi:hypothetical protein